MGDGKMKKFSPQEIAKILRCMSHQGECDPGDCQNGCPYYVESSTVLSQRKLYELAADYIDWLLVDANITIISD